MYNTAKLIVQLQQRMKKRQDREVYGVFNLISIIKLRVSNTPNLLTLPFQRS